MLIHRTLGSGRTAVHVALVLTSVLLQFPPATMGEPARSSPSKDRSLPTGLVVVIENKPQEDRMDLWALDNPSLADQMQPVLRYAAPLFAH